MHLGNQDSSASPKADNLGKTGQMGRNQRFSENGSPEDLFFRNLGGTPVPSDATPASNRKGPASWLNDKGTSRERLFSPSQAASGSPLGSPQTPDTIPARKGVGALSSDGTNAEGRSGNQNAQYFPLFSNVDGMATDSASTRSLNYRTTTSGQREKSLPRNQDTGTTPGRLQTPGKLTDGRGLAAPSVNGSHSEMAMWPGKSVPRALNGSSPVADEATDVDKTGASSVGFTLSCRGDKNVLRFGSPSLGAQVPLTPQDTPAPTQVIPLAKVPPSVPFSSNRASASETHGAKSAQISAGLASDLAEPLSCALCKSLKDKAGPMSCICSRQVASLWMFPSRS